MSASAPSNSRTVAAAAARRRRGETTVQRVRNAIAAIGREKARVSVSAVARRADVSRTCIYDNPQARAAVAAALSDAEQSLC